MRHRIIQIYTTNSTQSQPDHQQTVAQGIELIHLPFRLFQYNTFLDHSHTLFMLCPGSSYYKYNKQHYGQAYRTNNCNQGNQPIFHNFNI